MKLQIYRGWFWFNHWSWISQPVLATELVRLYAWDEMWWHYVCAIGWMGKRVLRYYGVERYFRIRWSSSHLWAEEHRLGWKDWEQRPLDLLSRVNKGVRVPLFIPTCQQGFEHLFNRNIPIILKAGQKESIEESYITRHTLSEVWSIWVTRDMSMMTFRWIGGQVGGEAALFSALRTRSTEGK